MYSFFSDLCGILKIHLGIHTLLDMETQHFLQGEKHMIWGEKERLGGRKMALYQAEIENWAEWVNLYILCSLKNVE